MAVELSRKHCVPCEGGVPALTSEQVQSYLGDLPDCIGCLKSSEMAVS